MTFRRSRPRRSNGNELSIKGIFGGEAVYKKIWEQRKQRSPRRSAGAPRLNSLLPRGGGGGGRPPPGPPPPQTPGAPPARPRGSPPVPLSPPRPPPPRHHRTPRRPT